MTNFMRLGLIIGLLAGCELVVDFDRDRINDGGDDVGMDGDVSDSGSDAGADGGADAGDAAIDAGDAAIDAATDAATDAADDAMDASMDVPVDVPMDASCTIPSDCDDSDDCTMDACGGDSMCTNTPLCAVDVSGGALTLDDLSTLVSITGVDAFADGFLVIHEDAAGSPGAEIGSAPVSAGTNADVVVELTRPIADAEILHAMLHRDVGVIGTYEPGTDPPETLMGTDVNEPFTATVPAGTPGIEVSVVADDTDWTFSAPRPSTLALPTGTDPDLTLTRGYRYRLINTSTATHPFELLDDGATVGTPVDDIAHLSQAAGVNPALESDATVDWDQSDAEAILFTASAAFEAAVNAYRGSIHTATERAAIMYADP